MSGGHPFFEVLSSVLNEEYKFPVLEVFAGLFALGTFVLAGLFGSTAHFTGSEEGTAFALVNSLTGLPIMILVVLMLKNITYGLGNDLERGILQTYLSYPIKRASLLSAKLLSSIGIALILFLGVQIFALGITAPGTISSYPKTMLISYLTALCYPLLLVGIVLILTLVLKKGGPALVMGIILYFSSGILSSFLGFVGAALDSGVPLRIFAVIRPDIALQRHYTTGMFAEEIWVPTLGEVALYTAAGYSLITLVFIAGYLYFIRRLEA